uniref:Uncharacterized protein n=1 Tax=Gopherus agassizii TaxID=38772 RepID=A0A452HY49_9SAUR
CCIRKGSEDLGNMWGLVVSVCMCVSMCAIHMSVCACVSLCTPVSMCAFMCLCVHSRVHVCLHAWVCMCLCVHSHVSVCMCLCVLSHVHVHSCVCVRACFCVHVSMCAFIYLCEHACLCVRVSVCACMSVHTLICLCWHVCLCVHMGVQRRAVRVIGDSLSKSGSHAMPQYRGKEDNVLSLYQAQDNPPGGQGSMEGAQEIIVKNKGTKLRQGTFAPWQTKGKALGELIVLCLQNKTPLSQSAKGVASLQDMGTQRAELLHPFTGRWVGKLQESESC